MTVRFCPACRSLVLSSFRFCPYCGEAQKGPELADALDPAFERLGRSGASARGGEALPDALPEPAADPCAREFAQAREALDRLEADMELILEELEKEGRSAP